MAGSLNRASLIGNLGADPEVRRLNNGNDVVSLRIATTESWRDKQTGDRRENTQWHQVVIFNENIGKVASQYLKKGSKVFIEGQLQTRKWQAQDGSDRYTTEIVLQSFGGQLVMLSDNRGNGGGDRQGGDFGRDSGSRDNGRNSYGEQSGGGARGQQPSFSRDLDDDIPF